MRTPEDWKDGEKIIGACMNCASYENLSKTMGELDDAGIDLYHLDIMDGTFVPNIALGPQDVSAIRKLTDRVCDVHLMVRDAARYVDTFVRLGAQIVHVHGEEDSQVTRTLQHIRDIWCQVQPCNQSLHFIRDRQGSSQRMRLRISYARQPWFCRPEGSSVR